MPNSLITWNPIRARFILDNSPLLTFIDESQKLSAFRTKAGRELALNEENSSKVSVYISRAPYHMPDVKRDADYEPNLGKRGRNSNLESITETLGFKQKVHRVHVESEEGLKLLLAWYQYA